MISDTDPDQVPTDNKPKTRPDVSDSCKEEHPSHVAQDATAPDNTLRANLPPETGGQPGPEPTRYGDWEKKGRCTDF